MQDKLKILTAFILLPFSFLGEGELEGFFFFMSTAEISEAIVINEKMCIECANSFSILKFFNFKSLNSVHK